MIKYTHVKTAVARALRCVAISIAALACVASASAQVTSYGPGSAIANNTAPGFVSRITNSASGFKYIRNVSVTVSNLNHGRAADLFIRLRKLGTNGASTVLLHHPGSTTGTDAPVTLYGAYGKVAGNYTFTDSAGSSLAALLSSYGLLGTTTAPAGNYRAAANDDSTLISLDTLFGGKNPDGAWELEVGDGVTAIPALGGAVTGSFGSWSLNLTPNYSPTSFNIGITVNEDSFVTAVLPGFDPEGQPLTWQIVSQPANGLLSQSGSVVTYYPTPNFFGTNYFKFRVFDGVSYSSTQLATIVQSPLPDAPISANLSTNTLEDHTVSFRLGNDPDLTFPNVDVISAPGSGSLTFTNNLATYHPSTNSYGTDSFTYRLRDNTGLTSSVATVTINVSPVNDAPYASDVETNTLEDTSIVFNLPGTDVDGPSLTWTLSNLSVNGSFTNIGRTIYYTPPTNYYGSISFDYVVSDGSLNSGTHSVSIEVTAVDDTPIASNLTTNLNEDTTLTFSLPAYDPDTLQSNLTWLVISEPEEGSLDISGDSFTYTPNTNYFGSDGFTYAVTDGTTTSLVHTVNLTINAVNDAPVASSIYTNTLEDTALIFDLPGSDVDSTNLTWTLSNKQINGTLVQSAPSSPTHPLPSFSALPGLRHITYTPALNFNGTNSFKFIVTDGLLRTATQTVVIVVIPVNDVPVSSGISTNTIEDVPLSLKLTGSDVETASTNLTWTLLSLPQNGTLRQTNNVVTYYPATNYFGSNSFTFAVSDGEATSAVQTVSITVASVNDIPVVASISTNTLEDVPLSLHLYGSDVETTNVTYILLSTPANGSFTFTNGAAFYYPSTNFNGTNSFQYQVSDGTATSAVATVTIVVVPVNDRPYFTSTPTLTGSEGTNYNYFFTVVDVDTQDELTVSSSPLIDWLTLSGTNLFGTPGVYDVGPHDVKLIVTDGVLSSTQSFTIFISPTTGAGQTMTVFTTLSPASEAGPINGSFNIVRSGPITSPVAVLYTMSGTADNASDYRKLRGVAYIDANQSTVTVPILPIQDNKKEAVEVAQINLQNAGTYTVGTPSTALILISDAPANDFNHDGKIDLIWRDKSRRSTYGAYFMSGTNNLGVSGAIITNLPGQIVVGSADINQDGSTDFIRQRGAQVSVAYMDTTNFLSDQFLFNAPAGYYVRSVGEYGFDRSVDFVLQKGSKVLIALMNGTALQQLVPAPNSAPVQASGDYDGKNGTDIFKKYGNRLRVRLNNGKNEFPNVSFDVWKLDSSLRVAAAGPFGGASNRVDIILQKSKDVQSLLHGGTNFVKTVHILTMPAGNRTIIGPR